MAKRIIIIFSFFIFIMFGLFLRLFVLTSSDKLILAANEQNTYTLKVSEGRGMIYDCNLSPLVNEETSYIASVVPTPENISELSELNLTVTKQQLESKLQNAKPFTISLDSPNINIDGVDVFKVYKRYTKTQIAPHVIGYLSGITGITGIERAFDKFLKEGGESISEIYNVDAYRKPLLGSKGSISITGGGNKKGVVLTIDKEIQKIAENAVIGESTKGAVVVCEIKTGKIKALVSSPTFETLKISDYLTDKNSSLINRPLSQYNVGSTFKLLVTACALESGISEDETYTCTGNIVIDAHKFNCHKLSGHGALNLKEALAVSCNTYFINLGQKLKATDILKLSNQLGFGKSIELAPSLSSQPGFLPTLSGLEDLKSIANISIGQGKLLASPLHIVKLISLIANHGILNELSLVEGFTNKNGAMVEKYPTTSKPKQVISAKTADIIKGYMVNVVENGSGKPATPENGGAGGKTASAETGWTNDNGKPMVQAWFSGFFPAVEPKYSIVVLAEGGFSGGGAAAPVFKKIANGINDLEKR